MIYFVIFILIYMVFGLAFASKSSDFQVDSSIEPLDQRELPPEAVNDDHRLETSADDEEKKTKKCVTGFRLLGVSPLVLQSRDAILPLDTDGHLKNGAPFQLKHDIDMNISFPDIINTSIFGEKNDYVSFVKKVVTNVKVPSANKFPLYSEGDTKKFINRESDGKLTCIEGSRYLYGKVEDVIIQDGRAYVQIQLPWEEPRIRSSRKIELNQTSGRSFWFFFRKRLPKIRQLDPYFVPLQPDVTKDKLDEPVVFLIGTTITVACMSKDTAPIALEGVPVKLPLYRKDSWRIAVEPQVMRIYKTDVPDVFIISANMKALPKSFFKKTEGGYAGKAPQEEQNAEYLSSKESENLSENSDEGSILMDGKSVDEIDIHATQAKDVKNNDDERNKQELHDPEYNLEEYEAELEQEVIRNLEHTSSAEGSGKQPNQYRIVSKVFRNVENYVKKHHWIFAKLPTHGPEILFNESKEESSKHTDERSHEDSEHVFSLSARVKAKNIAPILHAMNGIKEQYCLLIKKGIGSKLELRCPFFYEMKESLNQLNAWEEEAAEYSESNRNANTFLSVVMAYSTYMLALNSNAQLWGSSEGRRYQRSLIGYDAELQRSQWRHLLNPHNLRLALRENDRRIKFLGAFQTAGMITAATLFLKTLWECGKGLLTMTSNNKLNQKAMKKVKLAAVQVNSQLNKMLSFFNELIQAEFYCITGKKP